MPAGISLMASADDLAVTTTHSHAATLELRLREAIHNIDAWLQNQGLNLTVQKTVATLLDNRPFHRRPA